MSKPKQRSYHELLKALYNLTFADTEIVIRSDNREKIMALNALADEIELRLSGAVTEPVRPSNVNDMSLLIKNQTRKRLRQMTGDAP
jgi:hypothetical protein